ncbi:MAG: cytochrome P450 [Ktedonobacteraceae bacterium]|nr:cytochrome P450 [Ktedonobacteraceae bacterium]MBO0794438.1 cytochrome P450 [Ktedonobacteraceae bacterium]
MQNANAPLLTEALTQLHNPYPIYHRLRASDPVQWQADMSAWAVTSYADIVPGLRDNRLSAARLTIDSAWFPEEMRTTIDPVVLALTRQMLFLDPPDHSRLRGLVAKAFTPRVIEQLRGRMQEIVDQLLDTVQEKGEMDLVANFSYPLPAIVIAELLGVPAEDRDQFVQWTSSFGALLGGHDLTVEDVLQALLGVSEFISYFRNVIQQRRSAPRDDLLQAMIAAEEQGDKLSEEELLGNCVLLLAAGHGTTTHLISNGMLALINNPDQLEMLREDPSIISLAVLELLRYDSPVQLTSRTAIQSMCIGDKQIEEGQEVLFCLGAANRDPAQFAEPDRLNLRRQENRHLAFGQGIHYCLGAPLARVEAEIAFSTLVRRLRSPRLAIPETELEWSPSLVFRGLRSLPITFR